MTVLQKAVVAIIALLIGMSARATVVSAQEQPVFSQGFAQLAEVLGEKMGTPLEGEHPGGGDFTVQFTSTGLATWRPGAAARFTNGWDRWELYGDDVKHWVESDDPPVQIPAAPVQSGMPFGGAMGNRIYCIEAIESHHSAAPRDQYNPTPVWNGEHAQGWLGFLPSTAQHWGAQIGNRASEWAAAARMILAGAGGQFAGIAWGRC